MTCTLQNRSNKNTYKKQMLPFFFLPAYCSRIAVIPDSTDRQWLTNPAVGCVSLGCVILLDGSKSDTLIGQSQSTIASCMASANSGQPIATTTPSSAFGKVSRFQ